MTLEKPQQNVPFDRRAIPPYAVEGNWTAPDGHKIRRIDWPWLSGMSAKANSERGSLLFMPGRADFYEKYLESLDYWYQQGWRVTAADWRGQAFSGRLGGDDHSGHVADFDIWVRDLADFWDQWRAETPGPHVIVGHSMGGHIVLRALAEKCIVPDAAVLSAPMLGLLPGIVPLPLIHMMARLATKLRPANRSAWNGSEKPGKMPEDRFDLLTHDTLRYQDELWWRRNRPALALGAPSWGWIERAIASMRLLFAPGKLEAIDVPTLFIATSADGLVDYDAIKRAASRVPRASLYVFGEDARHEILRETDDVRDKALAEIDAFLVRAAPAAG